jgi:hypothetical protein
MNAKKSDDSKAIATVKAAGLPAGYEYDDEDTGAGFENLEAGDFRIPSFNVLQSISDQVKACRDGSVRAGMLYNTVSQIAYAADVKEKEPGVLFVPCYVTHMFNEWTPRKEGGGFVGMHQPHDPFVQKVVAEAEEYGKNKTPKGNDLVDTYTAYGIFIEESSLVTPEGVDWECFDLTQCFIPHTSTKISVLKNMLGRKRLMRIPGTAKPFPMFSHIWRLQTVPQSHAAGDSYNVLWNFAFGDAKTGAVESRIPTSSLLYQTAKEFYALCHSGGMAEATEKTLASQGERSGKTIDGSASEVVDEDETPF